MFIHVYLKQAAIPVSRSRTEIQLSQSHPPKYSKATVSDTGKVL